MEMRMQEMCYEKPRDRQQDRNDQGLDMAARGISPENRGNDSTGQATMAARITRATYRDLEEAKASSPKGEARNGRRYSNPIGREEKRYILVRRRDLETLGLHPKRPLEWPHHDKTFSCRSQTH